MGAINLIKYMDNNNVSNQGSLPQVVKHLTINGAVGTYIETVENLTLTSIGSGLRSHQVPTSEQMCQIVEKMMDGDLWYAGRAWAVVYRLYQLWDYQGKYSDFVKEVARWPFKRHKPTDCNEDAVSKPLRSGKYAGLPSTWAEKGAPADAVKLGMAMEVELNKILPRF